MELEQPTLITLDPVCGTEVDEQSPGATYEYEKKVFYFCSTECKETFAKSAKAYVGF